MRELRESVTHEETSTLYVVTYDNDDFDFSIYTRPNNARMEFAKELIECFSEHYNIRLHDLDSEYIEQIKKHIESELRYVAQDFPKIAKRYDVSQDMKIINVSVLGAFTANKNNYNYTCTLLKIEYEK